MQLCELAAILPVEGAKAADQAVAGLSSTAAHGRRGDFLFAALAGRQERRRRASPAKPSGAARSRWCRRRAPCSEPLAGVPLIEVDDPRRALALSAARFFGRQPQMMVAVTGTSGKTSVAAFTRQIWEHAGLAAASIGTIGVAAPAATTYGSLTTPDPVALHRLLAELAARRRRSRRHGSVEPRARPAPPRRGQARRRRPSPISAATTWTTIRRSRTISPPSSGSSRSCCRRVRRP